LDKIKKISLKIATAVAERAFELGIARNKRPKNIEQTISTYMYNPKY